ncbi:MAG: DNA adenine methylase [Caldilineaceae bacterium]|nr:DNA adenine methylase [Caldilineaceae bacterium]
MKRMPQPIPYQGSKRNIAAQILSLFPNDVYKLIEPFAGSAAVSIRAAYVGKAEYFHLNDLNHPLIHLLESIINTPEQIASEYEHLWNSQLGRERECYDEVRAEFNTRGRPALFLYLLARCVKASVRYNLNGEFNQGPDNRRKGRHPDSMRAEILAVSQLLKGKTILTSVDFRQSIDNLNPLRDLVYLDPPYQGTSGRRDSRYCGGIDFTSLVEFLSELNAKKAMYILSYDGRKGAKVYGEKLPKDLGLIHLEIDAGRSTQSTLLGKAEVTYESLYLSSELYKRLDFDPRELARFSDWNTSPMQLELALL